MLSPSYSCPAKIVQYLYGIAGATKDRNRFRDQVQGCQLVLQQLQDRSDSSEEGIAWADTIKLLEAPNAPVARMHEALGLIDAELCKKGTRQKIKWPFKEGEVDKLVETLDSEKDLLLLALQNNAGRLLQQSNVRSKDLAKELEGLKG